MSDKTYSFSYFYKTAKSSAWKQHIVNNLSQEEADLIQRIDKDNFMPLIVKLFPVELLYGPSVVKTTGKEVGGE